MCERLIGFFLLASSASVAYFCIYSPLAASARNEPDVDFSSRGIPGIVLCPLATVLGLFLFFLGPRGLDLLRNRAKSIGVGITVVPGMVLLIIFGVLLYLWLRSTLLHRGYNLKGL
jgi:hypothetical protein